MNQESPPFYGAGVSTIAELVMPSGKSPLSAI